MPAYVKGNRVDIYSMHKDLKQAFVTQQSALFFPVSLRDMEATINFHQLKPGKRYDIAGFKVTGLEQNHPGTSFGYCLQKENKKIIYSTDCEHKADAEDASYPFLDFIRNADLLISDTQYSFLESVQAKKNWGHSSNMMAVDLAVNAGVKHLCMFHTEPTQDDISLARTEELTRKYVSTYAKSSSLTVSLAYDGLEIPV
jgi:ribonuclease BN (tRNA processing enzyme)